ncbi:hypothetical protein CPC08DRAFT_729010 [Agrocybe pediades]|nr:hypothetical protein CPC08DRAFT_729010 [Agrocybe pediades]
MSTNQPFPVSVSQQKTFISVNLNSTLLFQFYECPSAEVDSRHSQAVVAAAYLMARKSPSPEAYNCIRTLPWKAGKMANSNSSIQVREAVDMVDGRSSRGIINWYQKGARGETASMYGHNSLMYGSEFDLYGKGVEFTLEFLRFPYISTQHLTGVVHNGNRTASKDAIVIGSLSSLYGVTALYIGLNWFYTNVWLCADGGTRVQMFLEGVTQTLPKGVAVPIIISTVAGFVIADGLLVGVEMLSCMWPVVAQMYFAHWSLDNGDRCLLAVSPKFDTTEGYRVFDRISATMFVAIAATSLVSTFMICREIYRRSTPQARSRGHYRNILDALIQSSGIYSVTVVFVSILEFLVTGEFQSSFSVLLVNSYAGLVSQLSSALVPTLMVARLFVTPAHENTEIPSASVPSELLPSSGFYPASPDTVAGQLDLERQRSDGHIGDGEEAIGEVWMINRPADSQAGGLTWFDGER